MKKHYFDLDLLIDHPKSQPYRARVRDVTAVKFEVPEHDRLPIPDPTEPKRDVHPGGTRGELGEALFRAVFTKTIEREYRLRLEQALERDEGLRIRLCLIDVPELDALPWETLYDPGRGQFLASMREISIVRYQKSDRRPESRRIKLPLRMLAILASPQGKARLSVKKEWKRIKAELAWLRLIGFVRLKRLKSASVGGLLEYLEKKTCHVLHFGGHGTFDVRNGEGRIVLETPNGGAESLDEQRLATALQRNGQVRLVVLNACHGARAAPDNIHSGLARRLVRLGVPAVIAMRSSIGDPPAVLFATRFYRHLVSGRSIEDAVAAARSDLFLRCPGTSWSMPVLTLGSTDPALLDLPKFPWWRFLMRVFLISVIFLSIVFSAGLLGQAIIKSKVSTLCPSPPGLDLRFVLVEAGVNAPDEGTSAEREPLVVPRDFCLGAFEVTQDQWRTVFPHEDNPSGWPGEDRPLERVSRVTAEAFVAALNDRVPGDPYRLPTETEWEYAARAGSTAEYAFGDDPDGLARYGNCRSVSGRDGFDGTAPVGSFSANAWGLYDMHGNVWEWMAEDGDETTPGVLRGGSYDVLPAKCRASHRKLIRPSYRRKDYGLRVARDPVPSEE